MAGLKEYAYYLQAMVDGTLKIVMLAIDLCEYLIDVECVAVASVLPLESSNIQSAQFDETAAN